MVQNRDAVQDRDSSGGLCVKCSLVLEAGLALFLGSRGQRASGGWGGAVSGGSRGGHWAQLEADAHSHPQAAPCLCTDTDQAAGAGSGFRLLIFPLGAET